MIVAGIDPGLDGAVAILDDKGGLALLYETPVLKAAKGGKRSFDLNGMREILVFANPSLVVIESVHAMPKQGVTSCFNFGMGYGYWIGLMVGIGIPFQAVTPQQWKGAILGGTKRDKAAAIEFVTRRFPKINLLATPKSRVPHDGFADASCLALYARQLMNGGPE